MLLSLVPSPLYVKSEKGPGQMCTVPVSQRNAIIELPMGVNKEAYWDYSTVSFTDN